MISSASRHDEREEYGSRTKTAQRTVPSRIVFPLTTPFPDDPAGNSTEPIFFFFFAFRYPFELFPPDRILDFDRMINLTACGEQFMLGKSFSETSTEAKFSIVSNKTNCAGNSLHSGVI